MTVECEYGDCDEDPYAHRQNRIHPDLRLHVCLHHMKQEIDGDHGHYGGPYKRSDYTLLGSHEKNNEAVIRRLVELAREAVA